MDSGWTLLHSNSSGAAAASEPASLCAECARLRVLNNALIGENAASTEEINETAEKLENLTEHHRNILYCSLGHRELIVSSAVIGDMTEKVIVLSIVVE